MNESWHTNEWVNPHKWVSRVTTDQRGLRRVTHMNESCRIEMSHDTFSKKMESRHNRSKITSRMHESRYNKSGGDASCHAYEWVLSNVWTRHIKCMNESCNAIYLDESHYNRSKRDVSCHTYEWIMSHVSMSPFTRINGSRHTWMGHVTHRNKLHQIRYKGGASCHTYDWVMSYHEWVTSHV